MPQSFPTPSPISNADFLRWNQGADNVNYPDATGFNMDNFGGQAILQSPYNQVASTQVTRRANNRQLVPTAPRPGFDASTGLWNQFPEEGVDQQIANDGEMEEDDNVELLEERAAVAKRDAQSKRKQIPPFVQKLSR